MGHFPLLKLKKELTYGLKNKSPVLFIQCENCAGNFDHCCSQKCKDFKQLPEEEQALLKTTMEFNGTKFGKGRYKAHRGDEGLEG